MSEPPSYNNPKLTPEHALGQDAGLMGTKNSDAKELSREEFLRMAA